MREGQKWTSFCPDQDDCVLKEEKDTQGINSGGSPNDNMTFDFSTPQFHTINDVYLHYVCFAKTIMLFTCKKSRELSI